MITFIVCERGTSLNSEEFIGALDNYRQPNVLDKIHGIEDSWMPNTSRIGDWVLLLDKLYTVSRRVIAPCPYGRANRPDPGYDTYYIVWPLSSDENDDEEE